MFNNHNVANSCRTHSAAGKAWVVPAQYRVATLNGCPRTPHLVEACIAFKANHLNTEHICFQHSITKASYTEHTCLQHHTCEHTPPVTQNTLVFK